MEILTMDGLQFLLRWFHFLAGVLWIGLLYYFNFVQVPFFAEIEAPVRTVAVTKLVPRALMYFRRAAMATFVTGLLILMIKGHQLGGMFLETSYGWAITLGGALATLMWANVWFVIWPNQKVVIASANQVAGGGQPLPEAAAAGRRAFLASRTNVLFSVPMLFFMGAASHLSLFGAEPAPSGKAIMPILCAAILGAIEINALVGLQGAAKKPLEKPGMTVHLGFWLTIVLYLLFQILF